MVEWSGQHKMTLPVCCTHRKNEFDKENVVENVIRIGKKGLGSNTKKRRLSLTQPKSRGICAHSVKCAFLHQHALQLMRGQVSMSNPAVLNLTGPGGRVDLVDKIINVATEILHRADARSRRGEDILFHLSFLF